MLVLTRRAGESIIVNDHIELKVLRIKGRQVHIGIDAPSSTAVHRKEVWERIRAAANGEVASAAGPTRSAGDGAAVFDDARDDARDDPKQERRDETREAGRDEVHVVLHL